MPSSVVDVPTGWATPAIVYCVTLRVLPSASRSFASTSPASGVSSRVLAVSAMPTGASLIAPSAIVTLPFAVVPWSVTK